MTCERFCILHSGSEQTSPGAADVRRLVIARPTPPSRLLLGPVSRDVIEQQQQQMRSWHRIEGSESVDYERLYMQATKHECRRRGLAVCLCAQPLPAAPAAEKQCRCEDRDDSSGYGDSRTTPSHVIHHNNDDRLCCQPRHTVRPDDRSSRAVIADDVDRCRCTATDVDDDGFKQRQSQMIVDYDADHQQPSTRTCIDTSLDSLSSVTQRRSSDEWSLTSADQHLSQQHSRGCRQPQRQHDVDSGSPGKKRLTLSCVLADFSGLLRRMRRLRVSRSVREHETRV